MVGEGSDVNVIVIMTWLPESRVLATMSVFFLIYDKFAYQQAIVLLLYIVMQLYYNVDLKRLIDVIFISFKM